MRALRTVLQYLLPLAILSLGAWVAVLIVANKKQPVVEPPSFLGPPVRTAVAAAGEVRIDVATQGTVEPFRAVTLSPQVGGRVLRVHEAMRDGAFVAAGTVLVEIETADFELAIVQQEANVARAELRLLQERAEADASLRSWRELEGDRPADPLVARIPQIADAERSLAAARAQLERSRLDLQRTRLTAPFAARVRAAAVEAGQLVQPGQALAELLDLAAVEVRLPIPTADAAFLDLPMFADTRRAGPAVRVTAEFGGRRFDWTGTVVRTESELDRRTRRLTVVARVEAPYERTNGDDRPPLTVGMFVQATIEGRTFRDVVEIPRGAVDPDGRVWVVDAEHRLQPRRVEVLRLEAERALLVSGVKAGERIVTSRLETPHPGMPVRDLGDAAPSPTDVR